jgi:hypothetical protein
MPEQISARDCPNIDIAHGAPPHQVTQTGLVGNALPAVSVDIYNIFRTPKVLSFLLGQIGTSNALVESTAKRRILAREIGPIIGTEKPLRKGRSTNERLHSVQVYWGF